MAKDGSIYLKPLMRGLPQIDLRPEQFIAPLHKELGRRLRAAIRDSTFSERAKIAFAKALQIKDGPKSVTVTINHPGWGPMVDGQKREQMTWLRKARRPIPIVLPTGELIFRVATARSLANGHWWHPGRAKQSFYEKAKEGVRQQLKKKIANKVRQMLAGRR